MTDAGAFCQPAGPTFTGRTDMKVTLTSPEFVLRAASFAIMCGVA